MKKLFLISLLFFLAGCEKMDHIDFPDPIVEEKTIERTIPKTLEGIPFFEGVIMIDPEPPQWNPGKNFDPPYDPLFLGFDEILNQVSPLATLSDFLNHVWIARSWAYEGSIPPSEGGNAIVLDTSIQQRITYCWNPNTNRYDQQNHSHGTYWNVTNDFEAGFFQITQAFGDHYLFHNNDFIVPQYDPLGIYIMGRLYWKPNNPDWLHILYEFGDLRVMFTLSILEPSPPTNPPDVQTMELLESIMNL